jgi:hypothetical protein
MDNADRPLDGIHEIDGATIGYVDAEAHAGLIRDQTIAAVEAAVGVDRLVDNSDVVAVHLFRGDEGRIAESLLDAHVSVDNVEATQRFGLVSTDVDPGDTRGKRMHHAGQSI